MVKPASQVERSRRVRLAQMWLTDFGRALRSRARWNFVEMLLAMRAAALAGVGMAARRLHASRRT